MAVRLKIKEANAQKLLKRAVFNAALNYTNKKYRPYDAASYLYREIIEQHQRYSLEEILKDKNLNKRHFELIYATLNAFNMNTRGAKLIPLDTLKENIQKIRGNLITLSGFDLARLQKINFETMLQKVGEVFMKLSVMRGAAQLVGISKTLHFLLPELIMPIDRKYTLQFFYGTDKYYKEREKEWMVFEQILRASYDIASTLRLKRESFFTVPKIIDNAIIGFISNKRNKNVS